MTDQALFLQSGTFTVSDNTFTDFRAPIDISQNNQANPIVSGTISNHVFSHITNRAIWLRQGGGATAAPTYPGVTASGKNQRLHSPYALASAIPNTHQAQRTLTSPAPSGMPLCARA